MNITQLAPQIPTTNLRSLNNTPPQNGAEPPAPSGDGFQPSEPGGPEGPKPRTALQSAVRYTKAALPIAAGVYAGLATGGLAGVAGAFAAAPGAAIAGGLIAGVAGEKLFGTSGAQTAGAALGGALVGGALGVAGGFYAGYAGSSVGAAVGLGLLGSISCGLALLNSQQQ